MRKFFLIPLALLLQLSLFGADKVTLYSGNWNVDSIWSPSGAPIAGDNITISAGHTVTLASNSFCANVAINSTGQLTLGAYNFTSTGTTTVDGTLSVSSTTGTKSFTHIQLNNGGTITSSVGETYTISGNMTLNGGTITGATSGIFSIAGNLSSNSSTSTAIAAATFTVAGTTTIDGTVAFSSITGTKTFNGAVLIGSGGVWSSSAAETYTINNTLTLSGGTLSGTASGVFTVSGLTTITESTINDIGNATINFNGGILINGQLTFSSTTGNKAFSNLTIASTGSFICSVAESFAISGNISNAGIMTPSTGTYTLSGASKTISGTATVSLGAVSVSGSYTNTGTLSIGSTLSGAGSLTNDVGSSLTIASNNTITTFNASALNNTVTYSSAAAQTVKGTTYHHLTITNAGTSTFGASATINGNLTVSGGTLADGGFQLIGNSSGSFSMAASTFLTLGTVASGTSFPTLFTNANISFDATSTVTYNSNVAQSISNEPTYGRLTLTATAAVIKTAANNLLINGNLTINTNNTLANGGFTITVKGNIVNNATHSGLGKLLITAGSTTHTLSGATNNLGNIEIDDATYSTTFTGSATTTIGGTLTVTNGTLNVGAFTTALVVTGTTTINGTTNFTSTTGTKTFNGAVVINGTWTNTANEAITFANDITCTGSFTPGTGTYTLSGAGKIMSGTITIGTTNLTGTYTNNGLLTISIALSGAGGLTNGIGASLTIAGTSTLTTLDASANNNTVIYSSAGTQTLKGITYHHLTITNAGTCTFDASPTINGNLTISGGTLADGGFQLIGNATGNLSMAASSILTLGTTTSATTFPTLFNTGNISLNNTSTVTYNSNVAQAISNTPAYGNLTLTATAAVIKTAQGHLTINGNLTNNTNNTLANGGFTISVKGNIVNNATHFGVGKLLLTGGSAPHTVSGATNALGNIEIDDAAQPTTISGSATTTIGGTLTITNGTLSVGAFTTGLIISGITTINGTIDFTSTTGTKTFNSDVIINGTWTNTANESVTFAGNITNNGSMTPGTGTYTCSGATKAFTGNVTLGLASIGGSYTNNGTLTITGNLTGAGSLINSAGNTIYFGGSVTITTLNATANPNTINYNSTGAQSIKSTPYHHLIISNDGVSTAQSTITVNGNLTISGGTFDVYAYQLIGNVSGVFTMANGTTLATARTATPFGTPFFTMANTTLDNNSTILYNLAGNQTIAILPVAYKNLTLSGSGTKTLSAITDIDNTLTISACTLDVAVGLYALTLGGNMVNDGVFLPRTGTVTFDGTTTLSGSSTTTFNHMTISGTFNAHATTTNIQGNLVNNGTFNANGGTLAFTGTTTLSGSATTTLNNLTISGTLTGVSSGNFNVGGNWENNGTFTHNNGTVTFNGTSTISGSTATIFKHITISGTLIGRSADNYFVTGNWTNNGTYTHNSGTVTFNGTSTTYAGTSNTTFFEVKIPVGTNFTIPTGKTLTVADTLFLYSDATGTSSLVEEGTGTTNGVAYVQRYFNNNNWHYFSMPVASGNVNAFYGYALNWYNEATVKWVKPALGTPLNIMQGYSVKRSATILPSQTITYIGELNSGEQSIGLSYTPAVAVADRGWNLVGNPYPSAIDWDASGWTKTNVNNSIYFYNGTTNNYDSYVDGVGNPISVTGIIPAMQGFYVLANNTGATLGVSNDVRTHHTQAYYKRKSSVSDILRLRVTDSNMKSDETVIRFKNEATNQFDDLYDAAKLLATTNPQIYSLNTTKTNTYAINALEKGTPNMSIPIGINVASIGTHVIQAITNDLGNIYLEDTQEGIFTNINEEDYPFSATVKGLLENRFILHVAPITTDIQKESTNHAVSVFVDNKMVYVSSSQELYAYEIITMLGQQVEANTLEKESGGVYMFQPNNLTKGTYIVRFNTSKGFISAKLIF